MKQTSITCLLVFTTLTVITGVIYPLFVTLVAQGVFPYQANGSIIRIESKAIGSELLGQPFSGDGYFWSRPSATSTHPYDGRASSGSNLAPSNPALKSAIAERMEKLGRFEGKVPVDLVTSSASGLDPHISPATAYFQVERISKARMVQPEEIKKLIERAIEKRTLGLLGEPRVNVLKLNLALDSQFRRN